MNCLPTVSIRRQILFHETQKNETSKWTLNLQDKTVFTPNSICQKSVMVQVSNLPSALQLRERQTICEWYYFILVTEVVQLMFFKENFTDRRNLAQVIL